MFIHQLPIEFNFPKAQWCKIAIRSLALVKLRVRHVKCILSFREDETTVRCLIFFVAKRMSISSDSCKYACASLQLTPQRLVHGASSGLRGCRRRRLSKIGERIQPLNTTFLLTSMPVFGSKSAVQIKCHSKTLDRFKERRWG